MLASYSKYEIFISDHRLDSDGSKDSSLDSGTEVRQYSETHRETTVSESHFFYNFCNAFIIFNTRNADCD